MLGLKNRTLSIIRSGFAGVKSLLVETHFAGNQKLLLSVVDARDGEGMKIFLQKWSSKLEYLTVKLYG